MNQRTYLFVLPWESHHVGGVNLVVRNLAATMARESGWQPLIAINDWAARRPVASGEEVKFRFTVVDVRSPIGLVKGLVTLLPRLVALRAFLRTRDVGAVNFHYVGDGALGVALLRMLGLFRGKLVLSLHGTDVSAPAGAIERVARGLVFRAADATIVVSRGLADRAAALLGLRPETLRVIPNGVDHRVFCPGATDASAAAFTPPARYLLNVGRYIPVKNQMLLYEAFATLAARFPDLSLCMAGDDAPERDAIARRAAQDGLGGRVHLLQFLAPSQVAHLMARAAAYVQPSISEGMPLTVLEAAAAGAPLVVSDIPGHDELVDDGRSGLRFPSRDATRCAAAIGRLLEQPALARQLADVQRARVQRDHTWSACLAGYLRAVGAPDTMR